MINYKIIFRVLGFLLLIEGFFLLVSFGVSLLYNENDKLPLMFSAALTLIIGGLSHYFTRDVSKNLNKREGYIIVSLVWVVFSLFGALPFYIGGAIPSYTDAFFETISGFTTTGASILNNIEEIPHGLLFWRSITQWLGGMGMIVMSLAILPLLGIGGMQLYVAEVPGPTKDKLHPRVRETAKRLWGIYIVFTGAQTVLLLFGGMNLFDAINHSLTTMATGGYSTKQASVAFYDSAYIQYVITFFMFVAGTNFTLAYFAFKGKFGKVFGNEEFRYYFGFVVAFTLIIAVGLALNNNEPLEKSFRDSLFQVVSMMTTTGFATVDYLNWTPFLVVLIFGVMFFGGSAGSTGGGIKIVRIVLLLKNSLLEFKRLIHPNAVIPVRLNHKAVKPSIVTNVLAFIVFYILIFVVGTVLMSAMGLELDSAMGSVIATLGNIGPGIGSVGPSSNFAHIPTMGKWLLSFFMLVGRLELFTVLVLFTPAFWKK